jgi:hypothetical protein
MATEIHHRRLHTRNGAPHGLGRHVQHDERSRAYPARRGVRRLGTTEWPLSDSAPLLDQGDVGRCTGWSAVNCMNTTTYYGERRKFNRGRVLGPVHGDNLYHRATELDIWPGVWPPQDTGSSGLAVAKALKEAGYISEYRHAFGIDHLLDALMLGPVLVGTTWLEDMFYPAKTGEVSVSGQPLGGHEYLCNYVNLGRYDRLGFINTWGRWGKNGTGRFYIPIDKFEGLLHDDGDVTILVGSVP